MSALRGTVLAAGLCALLAGCQAAVDLSDAQARYFKCDYGSTASATQCTDGWVCGKEGYCHPTDKGVQWQCDTSAVCDPGWKCGLEGTCHSNDAGVAYACVGDDNCDPDWRCNANGRCSPAAAERLVPGAADPTTAVRLSPKLFTGVPDALARGNGYTFYGSGVLSAVSDRADYVAWSQGTTLFHAYHWQGFAEGVVAGREPGVRLEVHTTTLPAPSTAMAAKDDFVYAAVGANVSTFNWSAPDGLPGPDVVPFPFAPEQLRVSDDSYDFQSGGGVLVGFRSAPARLAVQPQPADGGVIELTLPAIGTRLVDVFAEGSIGALTVVGDQAVFSAMRSYDGTRWMDPTNGTDLDAPVWQQWPLNVVGSGPTSADPDIRWTGARYVNGADGYPRVGLIGSKGGAAPTWVSVVWPVFYEDTYGLDAVRTNVAELEPCGPGESVTDINPSGFTLNGGTAFIEDFTVDCRSSASGAKQIRRREWVCDYVDLDTPCTDPRVIAESPSEPAPLAGTSLALRPPLAASPLGWIRLRTTDPEWDSALTLDRAPESFFVIDGGVQAYTRRNAYNEPGMPGVARWVPTPYGLVQRIEAMSDDNGQALEIPSAQVEPIRRSAGWAIEQLDSEDVPSVVSKSEGDLSTPLFDFPRVSDIGLGPFHGETVGLPDGGTLLVVTAFDALLSTDAHPASEQRADAGSALPSLEIRGVPAARTPIQALALGAASNPASGLVSSGFLIAGHRVYSVQAHRLTDWRMQALELQAGDPVAVFVDRGAGRVGLDDGRVLSLPNLIPLAGALPELAPQVSSMVNLCGVTYAAGHDAVYRLAVDAAGAGSWSQDPVLMAALPGTATDKGLAGAQFHVDGATLYLVTANGAVVSKRFASCP